MSSPERPRRFPMITGLLVAAAMAASSSPVLAADDTMRFIDALKQRGYEDMALYYLEQLKSGPDCPPALAETLDFEIGQAHRAAAERATTTDQRRLHLNGAQDAFDRFLEKHPGHELQWLANTNAGLALMEQAKLIQAEAELPGKSDAERRQLSQAARNQLEQARSYFTASEKGYFETAKAMSEAGAADDPDASDRFEEVKALLLQARLLLASVEEEIGLTYPEGSKKYQETLTKAADAYHALFIKYNTRNAGLYAKLYEARTRFKLGRPEEARGLVKELTIVPTRPDTMALKVEALALLVEIAMDPEIEDYVDAVRRVEAWQAEVSGGVEQTLGGLKVHLLAAKARLALARSMKSGGSDYVKQIAAAKRHLEHVQKFSGPYRKEAMTLLLRPEFAGSIRIDRPATFEDAVLKGDAASGSLQVIESKWKEAEDPAQREKLGQELDRARDEAIDAYRHALTLASPAEPIEAVNRIRYILAQLYFLRNDLFHAAVLSETLAARYPETNGAKMALLAAKAYRKMMLDDREASRDASFARGRLEAIADYATTRWGGSAEADETSILLIDAAIESRDLDRATALLEKIAADSPRRGATELRLGQTLWADYLAAARLDESQRPSQAALEEIVATAESMLEKGLDRVRGQLAGLPPDRLTVISVLALAQIKIDRGQAEAAVRWLSDPEVGPLTLIKGPSLLARDDAFKVSVYMTALRAYVGAQQLDQAETTMDSLETLVGTDDAESAKKLTRIYIVLGRQLEELLTRLGNEGKTEEMKEVSRGFESFLERISQREAGNTFSSLNWVAETYFSLGAGLDRGVGQTPPEAVDYFKQAARTYDTMRTKAEEDPSWAPEGAADNITVRLAMCCREMASAEQDPAKAETAIETAMQLLLPVIKANPKRVNVQIEAAKTYQAWGNIEPGYYEKAIAGGQEHQGVNLVWGWGTIARRVAPYEQYRDIYFDAVFNKNLCRVLLAKTLSGDAREKQLERAELDILRHHRMYPTMGGPDWFQKFSALLRRIRSYRGEKNPRGLMPEGTP